MAKAKWAGGDDQAIFDPSKGGLKINDQGGAGGDGGASVGDCHSGDGGGGGRGGKVTVIYPAAHPELKDLVTVDNSGGAGGNPDGDPGETGPDPAFKPGN